MKKHLIILSALACMAFTASVFTACEKDKESKRSNETSAFAEPATLVQPGCSVSCAHGRCSAYGTNCECTCTFFGYPKCDNLNGINHTPNSEFDGREYVVLEANTLEVIAAQRELLYSFQKSYATEVADKLAEFTDLVNTYGLNLNTKDALLAYYSIIDYCNARESQFSMAELTQVMDM